MRLSRRNSSTPVSYAVEMSAGVRIGPPSLGLPFMFASGQVDSQGSATLSLGTRGTWQPMNNLMPILVVPEISGSMTLGVDGSFSASATHSSIPLVQFNPWIAAVDVVASVVVYVPPKSKSGDDYTVQLNLEGKGVLGDNFTFTFRGPVDLTRQWATLTLAHEGGYGPFPADWPISLCTPHMEGSMKIADVPRLEVEAMTFLSTPLAIIPVIYCAHVAAADEHA